MSLTLEAVSRDPLTTATAPPPFAGESAIADRLQIYNASTGTLSIRALQEGSSTTTRIVRTGTLRFEEPPVESYVPSTNEKAARWGALLQFATVCWCVFSIGWNDGTTGPLLPRIQSNYNVGYAVVSLIFVLSFVGFIVGALLNVHLVDRIGFGKAMVLGAVTQVIGYAIQSFAPPFPVFILAFAINGVGIALQDAGANAYVASIKDNSKTKMSILHSIYGTGAFLSPLSATEFSHNKHWALQYLTALGISLVNIVLLITVFRFKRQEVALAEVGQARTETVTANNDENKYRQIFRLREVHYLAFFLLIYVGVAVTIGGWSVTYIITVRGGGPNSGYISSGFFGGVAFGRLALLWVTKKLGDRLALFTYILIAIGLQLVVWLVPSLIGDAVAVSLVGFVLGPLYPVVISHAGKILPHWLFAGAVGWIAGFGQAGSAFVPLITGAIASREGIAALQPIMLAMMSLMFGLWLLIPRTARRVE